MTYQHRAAFVLKEPAPVPVGARLRVVLLFGHFDSGGGALYIQRARVDASDSDHSRYGDSHTGASSSRNWPS